MQCRRSRTHAVSTGQTDFPVKFHGENTPALPGVRKGKSGRLLRRPQPDHPAATVDEFCTAVLTGPSKTVTPSGVADNGGSNPVSGHSVVEAADIDAAIEMAKGCPILHDDGSVEVAEVLQM